MTREEIVSLLKRAAKVGEVSHDEFADYVVVLEQRKKVGDQWTTAQNVYMAVDGKLAMANEDHRRQGKRLDFGEPKVLVDTPEQLTLLLSVTSEIYGTRFGIATSRRAGGSPAEREFPWEVAETSAIGRALSAMGYGLLPGAGLASAEDMMRTNRAAAERGSTARRTERPASPAPQPAPVEAQPPTPAPSAAPRVSAAPTQPPKGNGNLHAAPQPALPRPTPPSRRQPPVSAVQRQKLIELYRHLHGGTEAEAARGLEGLFGETFGHGLNEASYDEGARVTAKLLSAQRQAHPS